MMLPFTNQEVQTAVPDKDKANTLLVNIIKNFNVFVKMLQ